MEQITSHINLLTNCMQDKHVGQLQNALESFGSLDTLFTKEYSAAEARSELSKILKIIENAEYRPNRVLAIEILINFIKCNKHVYANNTKLSDVMHKRFTVILGDLKENLIIANDEYIIKFYTEMISPIEEIIGLVYDINICL
jgi:hypothetical protein